MTARSLGAVKSCCAETIYVGVTGVQEVLCPVVSRQDQVTVCVVYVGTVFLSSTRDHAYIGSLVVHILIGTTVFEGTTCSSLMFSCAHHHGAAATRLFLGNEKNMMYTPTNTTLSTNKLHHARDDSENVFCIAHSIVKSRKQSRQTKKLSHVKTAYELCIC
jgi:hypothetical protein